MRNDSQRLPWSRKESLRLSFCEFRGGLAMESILRIIGASGHRVLDLARLRHTLPIHAGDCSVVFAGWYASTPVVSKAHFDGFGKLARECAVATALPRSPRLCRFVGQVLVPPTFLLVYEREHFGSASQLLERVARARRALMAARGAVRLRMGRISDRDSRAGQAQGAEPLAVAATAAAAAAAGGGGGERQERQERRPGLGARASAELAAAEPVLFPWRDNIRGNPIDCSFGGNAATVPDWLLGVAAWLEEQGVPATAEEEEEAEEDGGAAGGAGSGDGYGLGTGALTSSSASEASEEEDGDEGQDDDADQE